jgi:hypothetical protein
MSIVLDVLSVVGAIELVTHFFGDNKSATVGLVEQVIARIMSAIRK